MKAILLGLAAVLVLGGPASTMLAVGLLVVPAGDCAPAPLPSSTAEADPSIPETTRVVMPLPEGTYGVSSSYGWRTDPFTGERAFHAGTDFPAAAGTPILAAMDGVVMVAEAGTGLGNHVVLRSTVDGATITSVYGHILDGGTHVTAGQTVTAGQQIAEVGSTGKSTGPHLHFEIHLGSWSADTVDALVWLQEHDAEGISDYLPAERTCA